LGEGRKKIARTVWGTLPVINKIYNRVPYSIKNILASTYGRRLYRRRYANKYYLDAIDKIIERETWDLEQLSKYQDACLSSLLSVAFRHVPFYRNLLKGGKIGPEEIKGRKDLTVVLPVLDKSFVRQAPEDFIDERLDPRKLNRVYTSGTTGTPLCIYRDERADGLAYAFYEARWRLPYGISKDSRWAMLGGKLIIPQTQRKPPFWVWNAGLNQLYMSSYHLAPEFVESYLEEIKRRRLEYIHGYASSLYTLALFAEKLGIDDIKFKVAISNAEPLYPYQRKKISSSFNCRVVDTYGCTEWCFQGSECSGNRLHLSPDVGFFEVLDASNNPVPEGEIGELVCTGFVNYAQPLIRYKTGDSVRVSYKKCGCGSSFPVLESVEGRCDDLIILEDGRRVGRLDPVFKQEMPIIEAQIIQNDINVFVIKVVPDNAWKSNDEKALRQSFCEFVGNVNVQIEVVKSIPRTKSGKFKAVISFMGGNDKNLSSEKANEGV